MTDLLTPFDAALLLLWGFIVYLAAERGLPGLIVGVVSVLFWRPILLLAGENLFLALAAALVVGFLVTLLMRPFPRLSYRQPAWGHLLGAFGGVLLASVLVLTLTVSLPLGRDFSGAVLYPARDIPFSETLHRSRSVAAGRAILLYPLLERSGQLGPEYRGLGVLHRLLIVGQPWREV